jgi:hypothetical protein
VRREAFEAAEARAAGLVAAGPIAFAARDTEGLERARPATSSRSRSAHPGSACISPGWTPISICRPCSKVFSAAAAGRWPAPRNPWPNSRDATLPAAATSTASPPSRTLIPSPRKAPQKRRSAPFHHLHRPDCRRIRDSRARVVAYSATATVRLPRILRHHDSLCRRFCDNRPKLSRIPRQAATIEPGISTNEPAFPTNESASTTNEPRRRPTNPIAVEQLK